ncbi:uncharacterized protein LOC119398643 [Rhipicephalus sanguineus]|uniref:uncharacterized protein LOC119398643 n=1 Tax=Rhipicephalus sanguineus TaxID=34632 RepID=UPI001893CD40|nr:uncharacterized protein LOC119398643 [Rhipicephalus sanguineus]
MERLVKKRKVIRAQITRLINDYENRPQPLDENEAAILHARLASWNNEVNSVNDEIEPLVTDEDAENEFQQTCEYKDRIVACLARLQRQMTVTSRPTNAEPAGNGSASQTTSELRTRVKLPKFELVKFSGRRSDWQPFWEVFEQVVDKNEELSLLDKFHYLRSSVTGDAAAALAGIPPTSRCYRDAVELLKGRFGNNELLMQEHMRSLLDIKPVRSSDDVRSLRRLYDTLAAHICGLESLGRKLHTYGAMLLPVVQRAIPRDILLDFGRKCATDANSTFDDQRSSSTEGPEPTTPEGDRATVQCSGKSSNARVRVMFDGGSQRSYITSLTAQKLGCELVGQEKLSVGFFGGHQEERPFRRVKVFLEAKRGEKRELEVLETDVICDQTIPEPPKQTWEKLEALGYACADFSNGDGPKDIGLLIGADYLWELTTGRTVKLGKRLRAVETAAGWTVQGPVEGSNNDSHCTQTVTLRTSVIEGTGDMLSKFWTLESIGVLEGKETRSPTLDFFEGTVATVDGRYEVSLPWKNEIALGDNRAVAMKRLNQLTNRLKKSPDLLEEYDQAIRRYHAMDMAERVASDANDNHVLYYMPHQAVVRESRKLRVVFDASSSIKNSKSLNENLETGPNMTADLVGLLLNFRSYRVALVADIEQAFLQIGVRPEDRDALRFMWYRDTPRPGETLPVIDTWRMKRVPFGTTASPFLLSATLQHHLKACEVQFPSTAGRLKRSLYVDDLLTGANSEKEALRLYTEANAIFSAASMKLHKWSSNSERLRRRFEGDGVAPKHLGFLPGVLKVLGLAWDPITDELTFVPCVSDNASERATKRSMLQTTARIYDPLGWLSPFLVRAKILFQELWLRNIEWDDILPEDIEGEWSAWRDELQHIPDIHVPRHYGANVSGQQMTCLHIFADASPVAYGAVAYLVIETSEGVTSTIVMSKSRVAPLKKLTLARLELMACLLASRLCQYLLTTLEERPERVVLWTDSAIALCWIRGNGHKWQEFVRNRVLEIQASTSDYTWRDCPGKENPADLLTRGLPASRLATCELWWTGPLWVLSPESEWPQGFPETTFTNTELEQKMETKVLPATVSSTPPNDLVDVKRFSSFTRLIRVTAWVLRFVAMNAEYVHQIP